LGSIIETCYSQDQFVWRLGQRGKILIKVLGVGKYRRVLRIYLKALQYQNTVLSWCLMGIEDKKVKQINELAVMLKDNSIGNLIHLKNIKSTHNDNRRNQKITD
jgi:hypothetical protein